MNHRSNVDAAEPSAARGRVPVTAPAIVVLIHGLGRTTGCWRALRRCLGQAGYRPIVIAYPSTRCDIPELVRQWIDPVLSRALDEAAIQGTAVHIVTHSMGGILLRHWMQFRHLPSRTRVVMLAPPNRGSEVIDRLGRYAWFRRCMGPAAMQLSTAPTSWVNALPGWGSEAALCIIAGSRSMDPWFDRWFEGSHDGKVAVARTYLRGVDTRHVLPTNHTWIMNDRRVRNLITHYLQHGDR